MLAWLLQCNPRCDYLQRVANKDQRWPPGGGGSNGACRGEWTSRGAGAIFIHYLAQVATSTPGFLVFSVSVLCINPGGSYTQGGRI